MKTALPASSVGKTGLVAVCASFAAAGRALVIPTIWVFPTFFVNFSCKVCDWKLSVSNVRSFSADFVHLDMDDRAVKEFGQWLWDRALSTKIVEKLTEFGAKIVVLDIYYASPGKSQEGDQAFFEAIRCVGNRKMTGFQSERLFSATWSIAASTDLLWAELSI